MANKNGGINWGDGDINGTSLVGYLDNLPWSFEESVARLKSYSGQDPTEATDGYKVSVEFYGTFNGEPFSIYDYKCDKELHIGGRGVNVGQLKEMLRYALDNCDPEPYVAKMYYDEGFGTQHSWGRS